MSNTVGGAQAHANKSAHIKKSSDVDDLREGISDLGSSVGDMANRQYQRAQDVATDALDDTSDAIQRNPLTAIGIGLGVGFLLGVILTVGRSH
jgi:ElaB/YqjD/DUF883 family membrane-anchored ribosome-binding protein